MKNNVITIILARKGSKRIKDKNLVRINNKPLICHTIECALESKLNSSIYLSTDCSKIKKIAKRYKINIIDRPKFLSLSNSKSEAAIEHAINEISKIDQIKTIIFLQPTSPFRPSNIIDNALNYFKKTKADSLFSSSLFVNHIWEKKQKKIYPLNYNFKRRQFDQEKSSQFNENGSFYIFKSKEFLIFKNRLFGKIVNYNIDSIFSYQIDEIQDIIIIEALMKKFKNLKLKY